MLISKYSFDRSPLEQVQQSYMFLVPHSILTKSAILFFLLTEKTKNGRKLCVSCASNIRIMHTLLSIVLKAFIYSLYKTKKSCVLLIKVEKTLQCLGVVSTSIVFSFSPPSKRNCMRVVANVKTPTILISGN